MLAFLSGHINRERLHFGWVFLGLRQPLMLPKVLAGHRCQLRMPSLGIVATFGSKGRGKWVLVFTGGARGCFRHSYSETPAQHQECGDWGCSGCSPGPSSIPEL